MDLQPGVFQGEPALRLPNRVSRSNFAIVFLPFRPLPDGETALPIHINVAFGVDKPPDDRQIVHQMVNYHEPLNRTFAALVDPTRRAILTRLEREDGVSVSELARPFAIKLPAVMKHLDVLDQARLITRSKVGRTVTVRLSPEPIREAMDWLRRYERFWSGSLDRLAAYAEGKEAEMQEKGG